MLSTEEKKNLLNQEIKAWSADKYRLELRARVFKNTGQDDQLQSVTERLATIEAAMDELEKERKALDKQEKSDG